MKSIANQYRDLQEGRMSQFNFMRNLRMNMPQQITNTTSFGDAVKILKNKGIITETIVKESEVLSQAAQDEGKMSKAEEIADLKAEIQALMDSSSQQDPEIVSDKIDDIKAKIEKLKAEKSESLNEAVNDSGKQEYSKFSEAENDNLNELIDGITIEHECHPAKTYDEIVSIVTKNLKKDPFYYTMYKLTGTRGNIPQTMDTSKPETHQMKYYTGENAIDTAREMKPVKDIEKIKADKAKATKAKAKNVKVDVFSLVAKSQRGIPKMKPLGEKMKNVVMKEAAMPFKDLPAGPNKYKMVRDSKNYIIKATNADGVEFQKGDTVKTHDGEEIKIVKFEESQGKVKAIYNKGMFFTGIDINDLEAPKAKFRPGVNMGGSFEKFKSKLAEMIREILAEDAPSKKTAASEITAKAVEYIDDYNEGEKTYKKSQLENVFDSYEDKVGRRFDDSVFEDVIDMLKAKGYTMAMKEMYDGRDNLDAKNEGLSPDEQKIVDDILETLQEGIFDKGKLVSYLKKGLITAAIIGSLLGSTQLDFNQKKDIVDTVKIEKTVDQDIKDIADASFAISYYRMYKTKIDKAAENDFELQQVTKEINRMVKDNETNNTILLKSFGKGYKSEIEKLIKIN
jgi:hypothetical protein